MSAKISDFFIAGHVILPTVYMRSILEHRCPVYEALTYTPIYATAKGMENEVAEPLELPQRS
jgi:hypothetical protein